MHGIYAFNTVPLYPASSTHLAVQVAALYGKASAAPEFAVAVDQVLVGVIRHGLSVLP